MIRFGMLAFGVIVLVFNSDSAIAQFGPVVWQQPAPVVWQPAPVVWQQPAPIVVSQRVPTVAAPIIAAPAPVTRVYRPAIRGYVPVRQYYSRRRPILGGTVTRSRYIFQPVAF